MDQDVEMKPVDDSKDVQPPVEVETQVMDTSEAQSEANGTIELKSDVDDKQQKEPSAETPQTPRQRKKRKKGKKIVRAKDYPKFYKNAYVRYCDDARPKIVATQPDLDPVEITKLVAAQWYGLPKAEKQPYLDLAKADKDRYHREKQEFDRLNPDGGKGDVESSPEKQKPGKKKRQRKSAKSLSTSPAIPEVPTQPQQNLSLPSTSRQMPNHQQPTASKKDDELPKTFFIGMDLELPIFTDTFLEHNKTIEAELKLLRKNNIEMEQQNSVLLKHVENMENGVRKVESEIALTKKKNMQLEVYLTKLRCLLAANFHSLSLPGSKGGATVENIDKYMMDLTNETKKAHSSVATKARDIIKNIDLKIMP